MNTIVITGFMGSGKSTVAKALAQLLNCEMVDLDKEVESAVGHPVRTIIETEGEVRFREHERTALRKLLQDKRKQVIALGGGAWISESNRDQIRAHGAISVWLDATFDLCWKRIASLAEERPLARNEAAARKLFSERVSCYELADLRVAVTEQSADETAAKVFQALTQHESSQREQH